jgi:hypothetical protein
VAWFTGHRKWCVIIFRVLLARRGLTCVWAASYLAPAAALSQPLASYYVRPDGGTGKQCNGTSDSAYPGHGSNLPCAWSNPVYALKNETHWKLQGGDRLLVGPGSYPMGVGQRGTGWNLFDDAHPAEAHLPPLPSGPSPATPTILAGAGFDQGCPKKPELWGRTVRLPWLRCLPQDDFAVSGIFSKGDHGENIVLRDLWIHGMDWAGIMGHFGSVTMSRVRISANGGAGWDNDVKTRGPFNPTVKIDDSIIEWNGCVEDARTRQPASHGCWGESAGGYGDGIGTDEQAGFWTITNSIVRYNTQDGLDLLYLKQPGAKIVIDGVTAYGNAGNQVKVGGEALITNNVIVANCSYFDGKPFSILKGYFWEDTKDYHQGDLCRANGDALVVSTGNGIHSRIWNNSIVGEGDFLIWALCQNRDESACDSSSTVEITNNIFRGFRRKSEFRDKKLGRSGELVGSIFAENGVIRDLHHNLFFHLDTAYGDVHSGCPMGAGDVCADPHFTGDVMSEAFDGRLAPGSPAIGAGVATPLVKSDHEGKARPQGKAYDIGAFQMRSQ